MKINKENIDEYIFDYLEGNLSSTDLDDFKSYIKANDDARTELNYWKQSYITESNRYNHVNFSDLKKTSYFNYKRAVYALVLIFGVGAIIWGLNSKNHTVKGDNNFEKEVKIMDEPLDSKTTIIDDEVKTQNTPLIHEKSTLPNQNSVIVDEISLYVEPLLENMETVNQRDIILKEAQINRDFNLEKIKMKDDNVLIDNDKLTKKRPLKEVDIIELNTEGF